jgi:hypothetical protein
MVKLTKKKQPRKKSKREKELLKWKEEHPNTSWEPNSAVKKSKTIFVAAQDPVWSEAAENRMGNLGTAWGITKTRKKRKE